MAFGRPKPIAPRTGKPICTTWPPTAATASVPTLALADPEIPMPRPVTLFTAQWADMPLDHVARLAASWGYDGLELACMGDHLDPGRAAIDLGYATEQLQVLAHHGLRLWALGNPLAGQLVSDPDNDERSDA